MVDVGVTNAAGHGRGLDATAVRVIADSQLGRLAVRALGRRRAKRSARSYWFMQTANFGDLLSPVILRHLTGREPLLVGSSAWGKILALGSVIEATQPGDVVWGSGAIQFGPIDVRAATVLAVRGPLTRNLCRGEVPAVYGDPAILLPEIYTPRQGRRYSVGVVPHYVDRDSMTAPDPSIAEIDVTDLDWRRTVDAICSCDVVLSSSLHGLIVAEAYGIPAVWIEASNLVIGGGFKFRDYYASTDRDPSGPMPWHRGMAVAVRSATEARTLDPRALRAAWSDYWEDAIPR